MQSIGDTWRQFDLHVHSPISNETHYGDKEAEQTWNTFYKELEKLESSLSILGINDYWTIEGYRKVRNRKSKGRLKNVDLLIPVVELRLSDGSGHKKLQNYHVAFSPEIPADTIQSYFLDELNCKYHFGRNHRSFKLVKQGLIDLGEALYESNTLDDKVVCRTESDFEKIGYSNFSVSLEDVQRLLSHDVFNGKHITFVGYSETKPLSLKGVEGLTKQALYAADGAFLASPTDDSFENNRRKLQTLAPDCPLIHGSDAHRFDDGKEETRFLGKGKMWARCSPSFESLRFAIRKHTTRLSYGFPVEVERKSESNANCLQTIEVFRQGRSKQVDNEVKFSYGPPVNPGYVTVIGNKGQGKSALVDWISIGTTKESQASPGFAETFSFLNPRRFKPATASANAYYQVTTHWRDKNPLSYDWKTKNEPISTRVDYFPQSHLERLCSADPGSETARELESIIRSLLFRRLPDDVQSKFKNIDELLNNKVTLGIDAASQIAGTLAQQQQLAFTLIERIRKIESWNLDQEQAKLEAQIENLRRDLPESNLQDPYLSHIEASLANVTTAERRWHSSILRTLEQELDTLADFEKEVKDLELSLIEAFSAYNSQISDYLARERDSYFGSLSSLLADLKDFLPQWKRDMLRELVFYKSVLKKQITETESVLEVLPSTAEYLKAMLKEEQGEVDKFKRILSLQSGKTSPESDTWTLSGIENLRVEKEQRQEKLNEILELLSDNALTAITAFTSAACEVNKMFNQVMRDFDFGDCSVTVEVKMVDRLDEEKLHSNLKKVIESDLEVLLSARNTILKSQNEQLSTQLREYFSQVAEFVDQVMAKNAIKSSSPVDNKELFLMLSSFETLNIKFELSMDGQTLDKLSPGQRGLVLLLFILYLDSSSNVLIVDQPEDNLDNDTIRRLLVPAIQKARVNRQVIAVTHNANIGVLGDPDQVIICSFDKKEFTVKSGSLSEGWVRDEVLNLLEGASEAFKQRGERYGLPVTTR